MSSHLSPAAQVRHRIPRIAGAAVERARLTVVPRRRTRAARVPFVALVSVLMLGGVVGLLLFNTSMQQASFAATALEEQATALSAREQTLKMDLERLRDPQVLAEKARNVGLVPAPSSVCFLLPDGSVEGTCAPAVATDALPIDPPPPAKPSELTPDPVIVQARGAGGNGSGDTTRGSGAGSRADGRTGQQQTQQSQQSQETQQSPHQTRNR